MIKIAICDDEKCMVDDIASRVSQYFNNDEEIFEIQKFNTGLDLVSYISEGYNANIIFMDIEIGDVNGIDIVTKIRSEDSSVIIIFITSYTGYESKAFRLDALQYLKKPVNDEEFNEDFARAIKKMRAANRSISIRVDGNLVSVNFNDILYIEVYSKKITIHTNENDYVLDKRSTLAEMEVELNSDQFYRCHKSYILNLSKIKAVANVSVILDNNEIIFLSSNQKQKTIDKLNQFSRRL